MMRNCFWLLFFFIPFFLSCARKDIDRAGNIRLRGEKEISIKGKKKGDLLQKGLASWYGEKYHGRKTSNGEIYNMNAFTAAHKTLPFNTVVRVENQDNGRQTWVRINDRGPFIKDRIIDLSKAAAKEIGVDISGIAPVKLYLAEHEMSFSPKPEKPRERTPSYWTIQVGSFSEFFRARNLVSRFEECGHKVRIEKFDTMFRVRIGSFTKKEDAERARQQLDLTGLDAWILEDADK